MRFPARDRPSRTTEPRAATDGIASDASAVDAAANDNQVELAKVLGHSGCERLNKG